MIRFLLVKIRNTWTSSGPMSHSSLVFSTSLVFQCWTFQTTSTKNSWHGNWEHQDGRGSQEKGFLSFPSKVARFLTFDICQMWEFPSLMFGTTERLQSAGAQAIASGYSPPSGGAEYRWHTSRWQKSWRLASFSQVGRNSCDFFLEGGFCQSAGDTTWMWCMSMFKPLQIRFLRSEFMNNFNFNFI